MRGGHAQDGEDQHQLPVHLAHHQQGHKAGEEEDAAHHDGGRVRVDGAAHLPEDEAAVEDHHVEAGHLQEEHHEEGDGEGLEDLRLQEHRDGLPLPLPDPQLLLDHLNLAVKSLWSSTPKPLQGLLPGPLVAFLKQPVRRLGHASHCQGKGNHLAIEIYLESGTQLEKGEECDRESCKSTNIWGIMIRIRMTLRMILTMVMMMMRMRMTRPGRGEQQRAATS